MSVVVTGAGGYIGSRLVPRLLADGHEVRATFTNLDAGAPPWWSERAELHEMDVFQRDQVRAAVEGADCVYYLIHSMSGRGFVEQDRSAAENMARACASAGVRRVVYVSGLVPDHKDGELSDHLSSRLETEQILNTSGASTVTLRCAIVLGSASTSFEILRQICERLPVHAIPDWMDSQVQPIAVVDVLEALVGALAAPNGTRHYDVGGVERLSYPALLARYCNAAGLWRPQIKVPLVPSALVALLAARITDLPNAVVEALVESLKHDMVCGDEDFVADLLPEGHRLTPIDEAIARALRPLRRVPPAKRDSMGPMPDDPQWSFGGSSALGKAMGLINNSLSKAWAR